MPYSVYIVRCSDGTYYTGYAKNTTSRLKLHNLGKGAKYTRSRTPVELVYEAQYETKSEALQNEHRLKQLSRLQKTQLIEIIK